MKGDGTHVKINIPSWYADYVVEEVLRFYKEFPHLKVYWDAKVFGMMMLWRDYRKGFSSIQRSFIHDVFGHQCAFYERDPKTGYMQRCTFDNMSDLQIHHINPSGWFDRKHLKCDLTKNHIRNAFPLCSMHHYQIHPDIPQGFRARRFGDPKGLDRIFVRRILFNMYGMPYWVTTWDDLLRRLNRQFLTEYDHGDRKRIGDYPILDSRRNFPEFPHLAQKLPLVRVR